MMRSLFLVASIPLATAVSSVAMATNAYRESGEYEEFRRKHGHRQGPDHVGYHARRELYHSRLARIAAHNSERRSWVAGVNRFADYTDEELHRLLGYKRGARSMQGPTGPTSFLQVQAEGAMVVSPARVAREVDWRPHLDSSKFIRDQGNCGSCWAVAAVGALEMTAELKSGKGNITQLSHQQLVDCTPNPHHCGGSGGCDGATAELAFEYVQHHGLHSNSDYETPAFFSSNPSCSATHATQPKLSLDSWTRLPTNEGHHLLAAVANNGPVVVSVDGSQWMPYSSGVFDSCAKDIVVNHAVLTVGYGVDKTKGEKLYWLIRNSWGGDWGEEGHIRLLRHAKSKDHCGVDNNPKEGVGCDGGPSELPVCGMCGILSDSSHPVGAVVHA